MKKASYKIRFNSAKTVKAVNAILDARQRRQTKSPSP